MRIQTYKIRALIPPRDSLKNVLKKTRVTLKEGDVVAVSSKVVSISEGRCIPITPTISKDTLAKEESGWFLPRSGVGVHTPLFTLTQGALISISGIDESNGNNHFILYPKHPLQSAKGLLLWFKKTYKIKKLGLIITDSRSMPLRRGVVGFALSWAGFLPLWDYRGTKDIFGRSFVYEYTNIPDALAAAAVLAMGEGSERTPIAVIRDIPRISFVSSRKRSPVDSFVMEPKDDLFASLLLSKKWRRGKGPTTLS